MAKQYRSASRELSSSLSALPHEAHKRIQQHPQGNTQAKILNTYTISRPPRRSVVADRELSIHEVSRATAGQSREESVPLAFLSYLRLENCTIPLILSSCAQYSECRNDRRQRRLSKQNVGGDTRVSRNELRLQRSTINQLISTHSQHPFCFFVRLSSTHCLRQCVVLWSGNQ